MTNYEYLLEQEADHDQDPDSAAPPTNMLCYVINTDCKYPFLQILLENTGESLGLPTFSEHNPTNNKGMVLLADEYYQLVNMTDVVSLVPVLPSEIIHQQKVGNIPIDDKVVALFTDFPRLGLLTNPTTKEPYMLPDVAFTRGPNKLFFKTRYCNGGDYFLFYRSLSEETGGSYCQYAVFMEGKLSFSEPSLLIDELYPEPCILICNRKKEEPNLLVKRRENFTWLR